MRTFRSPNSGQTALTLQHSTSPASGYRPPAGHNADGYTMAERVNFAKGGKAKKKSKFPDHSGDGKITKKDILMAKGIIPKTKKKMKRGRA